MIQIEGKVYCKYDVRKAEKARELIECMQSLYPPNTIVDLTLSKTSLYDL